MKNRFSNFVLPGFWILAFIIIILIIFSSFLSHAASDHDYFPMYQNHNNKFSETLKNNIANQFDSTNNYVFVYYDQYNPSSGYGRHYFYYIKFPKNSSGMMYGEKNNNLYQWSIYFIGNVNYTQGGFYTDARYPNTINGVTSSHNSAQWFMNMPSSNYNSNKDFISNFQIYNNNTSSRQLVLIYDDGVSVPDGDTARDDMDIPDIDDYIPDWSNTPSFDNSSVESALESVYDGIVWIGSNIKDTITGTGKFIADTVRWGLQRIIDTIRDKIDDLKNSVNGFLSSINGFLSDIKGFVNYITEPLDLNEVESSLSNSSTYSLVNSASSLKSTYQDYFDSITAPSTLSFSISYTILTKSGFITFDFGWYDDIRDSVLPWIVGFLYMGFGLALFRSFPSIIHGVSGILQKGG